MEIGQVGILNVGTGDTKLSFDPKNPAERIRAARIVTDMLRRGYALLVEIERKGVKSYQRIEKFDEKKCEYIIADFDPIIAQEADENEETETQETPSPPKASPKIKTRAIKAESTKAVGVPRRAGG